MKIECPICNSVVQARSNNLKVIDFSIKYNDRSMERGICIRYQYHCPICWHIGKIQRELNSCDAEELFKQVPFVETLKKRSHPYDDENVLVEDDVTIKAEP